MSIEKELKCIKCLKKIREEWVDKVETKIREKISVIMTEERMEIQNKIIHKQLCGNTFKIKKRNSDQSV